MLALRRRVGEVIELHFPGLTRPVTVKVVEVRGRQVKLSIAAPRDVIVLRHELVAPALATPEARP